MMTKMTNTAMTMTAQRAAVSDRAFESAFAAAYGALGMLGTCVDATNRITPTAVKGHLGPHAWSPPLT